MSAAAAPADAPEAPAACAAIACLNDLGYSHLRAFDLAQLAEACGRFTDMQACLSELARRKAAERVPMSELERNFFSLAFKNRLSGFRGTLKMLGLVGEHETVDIHLAAVQEYARKMELGVLALASELLQLVVEHQLPVCEDEFSRLSAEHAAGGAAVPGPALLAVLDGIVFWYKLAADYCRYVAECTSEAGTVARHSDMALSYYSKARSYALLHLHPAAPALLGVTLNFSVFLFEIRRCEEEAFDLAQGTLQGATEALATDAVEAQEAREAAAVAAVAAAVAAAAGAEGSVGAEAAAVDAASKPPPAPASTRRHYALLTAVERGDSESVRALIAENLRVWKGVLQVASMVV